MSSPSSSHRGTLTATLLTLWFGLCGCQTKHTFYWPPGKVASPDGVPIAVIEFDERGDYWQPRQFNTARALLKSKQAPLLVTYVHGWRHDARPEDTDLASFRAFLNQLAPAYQNRIVGVYIGWRGAQVNETGAAKWISQPASYLSFWGRKKITDQMAGVPFQNTLWQLAALTRQPNNPNAGARGRAILIGHSFGGRIVERTIGPAAVAQMNNRLPMPYDLTFLVNPATESLYARQLRLALRGWPEGRPAIVALTARSDRATGAAWPLALLMPDGIRDRKYPVHLRDRRSEPQRSYITTTVGHDQRQWTHQLEFLDPVPRPTGPDLPAYNLEHRTGAPTFLVRQQGASNELATESRLTKLSNVPDARHQLLFPNAYWVIPLGDTILAGHGDRHPDRGIFNPAMADLMAGILATTEVIDGPRKIVPSANPGDTPDTAAPVAAAPPTPTPPPGA